MEVVKIKDEIHFIVPFWTPRSNPYMEGENVGQHPTLIGMIYLDEFGNEEMGFAKVIDCDYKDKPDQETDIMIKYWNGDKKDFIDLCKKLEIEVLEYPTCSCCGKSIFGSFIFTDKGNICSSCEYYEKITNKKEKIKELLKGTLTMQNIIDQGTLTPVGIDYIINKLTDRILEIFK